MGSFICFIKFNCIDFIIIFLYALFLKFNMKRKKQIVFIEGYSYVMTYKIARMFKEKGYETTLIRILKQASYKDFYNEAYNQVIDLDLDYGKVTNENLLKIFASNLKNARSFFISLIKILKLKPYVIIGRAPMSTPIAIFRILFRKTPFIYFPYDIRSQAIPTLKEAKKYIPLFEIKADRFCFEHSDGIMHKGAPNELEYLNGRMLGDNIKLPKHQITFHPYCSKEFCVPINKNKLSKKDGEIHFVYVGGAGKKSKEFYFAQLKCFKEIIKQKMHIHSYFCPAVSEEKDSEKDNEIIKEFNEAYKDYPNIKYFHLEKSFDPKEIAKEISKYDFGVFNYTASKEAGLEPLFCLGNKTSTYFEAGISTPYLSDYKFIDKLMRAYKVDIQYPDNLKDLKKVIKKVNYKQLEKNILKTRQDFDMDKNFPRLEEFVKKVVAKKRCSLNT